MKRVGIVTRGGRPHVKSHVQKILMNPFYMGINRFDGKDYPGAQQALISKQTYDKIQEKLHNKKPMIMRKHNPLLKNMITCEGCNGVVTWQKQKGHYYGSCQRRDGRCKRRRYLREDKVQELIIKQLQALVSPSREVIDWVAEEMRNEQHIIIERQEAIIESLRTQIVRLERMDGMLYDDKLAGDITKEVYDVKHQLFMEDKAKLQEQLTRAELQQTLGLEKKLVLLQLSQKASEIFAKRTIEQKRLIIIELFENMTSRDDFLSVKYTEFSELIFQNVSKTKQILGD